MKTKEKYFVLLVTKSNVLPVDGAIHIIHDTFWLFSDLLPP